MKKNYISPAAESILVTPHAIMNDASFQYDGNAPKPETGGDAGDGEGSDSRRHRDIWADEEEEDY